MTYAEKLKDPRWQKKRLEILERDKWECFHCGDDESTLHVHHKNYTGADPWNTPSELLVTLCEDCHDKETKAAKEHSRDLIDALKSRGFMAYEIFLLAEAVKEMNIQYEPQYTMCAVCLTMTDSWLFASMVDNYSSKVSEIAKRLRNETNQNNS